MRGRNLTLTGGPRLASTDGAFRISDRQNLIYGWRSGFYTDSPAFFGVPPPHSAPFNPAGAVSAPHTTCRGACDDPRPPSPVERTPHEANRSHHQAAQARR